MSDEFEILNRLHRRLSVGQGVAVGPGDDTAVLEEGFDLLTTDLAVEEVHFRREWCEWSDVGWRTAVASLSDVAAMGGVPGPYVAGAAVPSGDSGDVVDALVDGMCDAGESHRASHPDPIGGDLTSSERDLFVAIAMLGRSPESGPVLRSGAEPGDRLVLVGDPGRSSAGVAALEYGEAEAWPRLVEAYRRPIAEVEAGRWLADELGASAMIDVSDGLLADLGHVAEASEVGARVEADAIPVDEDVRAFAETVDRDPLEFVLGGGEDFCLLAAIPGAPPADLESSDPSVDWSAAEIGAIVRDGPGVRVVDGDGDPMSFDDEGWRHFSSESSSR